MGCLDRRSSFLESCTRTLSLSFGFTFFLRFVFHTFLLERAGLSAFIVRNLRYVCFALGLALGNSSARDGLSHTFSPSFSVWCGSEIHPFEQYLERAATAIASAALTVAANDRRIRRQTASSSR